MFFAKVSVDAWHVGHHVVTNQRRVGLPFKDATLRVFPEMVVKVAPGACDPTGGRFGTFDEALDGIFGEA